MRSRYGITTWQGEPVEKIVNHARTLSIVKLGVLHQNIPIGTSGMKVVADEAARLTGMEVKGFQSTTHLQELAKAAQEVFKLDAQGVLVIGAPPFAAAGVAQLRKIGVTQSIFVLSDTAPGLLVKVAGDSARIVGEGLRRARDVTKPEALAKALRAMGELDFDGYRIDFSKGNAGSRFVDIAVIGSEDRLRY